MIKELISKLYKLLMTAFYTVLTWGIFERSREVDRMLEEIMQQDPEIEYYDDHIVVFKGFPPIWIANFPYAFGCIFDAQTGYCKDQYPSILKAIEFHEYLVRKLKNYINDESIRDYRRLE